MLLLSGTRASAYFTAFVAMVEQLASSYGAPTLVIVFHAPRRTSSERSGIFVLKATRRSCCLLEGRSWAAKRQLKDGAAHETIGAAYRLCAVTVWYNSNVRHALSLPWRRLDGWVKGRQAPQALVGR